MYGSMIHNTLLLVALPHLLCFGPLVAAIKRVSIAYSGAERP